MLVDVNRAFVGGDEVDVGGCQHFVGSNDVGVGGRQLGSRRRRRR